MEPSRGDKTICLPFESEEHYQRCVGDTHIYRQFIELQYSLHPELFPLGIERGFTFHDSRRSKKQNITIRRIILKGCNQAYGIRPSFVMPYMTERTEMIEKPLYLLRWGVSFDGLAYVFGKSPAFWYRASIAMGRPSIVGTTVKSKDKLPVYIVADEKHTRLKGEKFYIPTTASKGCILGASVVASVSADALEEGYGDFAQEAKELDPEYSPKTVCADGWQETWTAWWRLFPCVTIILCFLHSVINIRKCPTSVEGSRSEVLSKVWEVYAARTKASFSQRVRRLREWVKARLPQGRLREAVLRLCDKRDLFKVAFAFDSPYRTSNGVDRLMNHQDRMLYAMQYFHGKPESARMSVRSMALVWNFHPYGARLRRRDESRQSPFHDLNGFEYHENWLQNYLVASSLNGHRCQV